MHCVAQIERALCGWGGITPPPRSCDMKRPHSARAACPLAAPGSCAVPGDSLVSLPLPLMYSLGLGVYEGAGR